MTTSNPSTGSPSPIDITAILAGLNLPAPLPQVPPPPPIRPLILPQIGQRITSADTGHTYIVDYRFLEEGHYSVVFRGTDEFDDTVAIKVLKPRGTFEEDRLAALGEVERLLTLRHKKITHVQDAFVFRDVFYIVTEECGMSVDSYLGSLDNRTPFYFQGIARCVLAAVEFIHRHGMVHLDLHPGNVFFFWGCNELDRTQLIGPTFKIGDLGITKPETAITPDVTLANWMKPPEALDPSFGPLGKTIDIYHCGLLLLQVALGRRLRFSQDDILNGVPREMALRLPEPQRTAIEKALRRRVVYRTPTARQFWLDLKGGVS
jgi:serine/threonine protein kinase